MVPMVLICWIYHFWARFWPYFNFVDFQAYFGPFSHVNRVESKPYGAIGQIWSLKSRIFFGTPNTQRQQVLRGREGVKQWKNFNSGNCNHCLSIFNYNQHTCTNDLSWYLQNNQRFKRFADYVHRSPALSEKLQTWSRVKIMMIMIMQAWSRVKNLFFLIVSASNLKSCKPCPG